MVSDPTPVVCLLAPSPDVSWLATRTGLQRRVDPEDLSRELLIRLLPRMMRQGPDGMARLMRYGREWGLIRRSGRIKIEAPLIDPSWITPPPEEILHPQEKVRHAHREVSAA